MYTFPIDSGGNLLIVDAANVDLLALHNGGIKCAQSCLLRWEEGNNARSSSGPILFGNTWKINPTILYYI